MARLLDLWRDSNAIDRFFHDVLHPMRGEGFSFSPSCEITEEDNSYLVSVDLPGVSKDNVNVEVDRDRLTITAERKEERKEESKKKYLSEISYGSYMRQFTLPGPVDEKNVRAKFENGVLKVQIPKSESVKTKQIPIQ